ncbi:MAG: DUF1501 domain-containing protein [Betaproteobacteria bacterium]|nr:DUF1501 domain-containing protein [Betaproteobacteria bacterium]
MDRRNFLRSLGYGTAGLSALAGLQRMVAAAPGEDYRAVVCLFMFGGNDANNMLIPYDADAQGYNLYAKGRTSVLALPRDQLLPVTLANTNGRSYALHPAMAGMQGLINTGKAAVVANVGTLTAPLTKAQWDNGGMRPPNLFSHSDQQNEWQTGTPDGSMKSGWGGRLAEMQAAANGTNALYATLSVAGNALYLNGNNSVAYKVSPSGSFGFDFYNPANTSDALSVGVTEMLASQRTHVMEQTWLGTIDRSIQNQKVLSNALNSVSGAATFPNSDLGNQLKMITRLIAARATLGLKRQAFFASIGGFDTHGDDQLTRQNQLLGDVSASVAAFQAALVQLGIDQNVTLFTASDFNRTFPSNGQGSDHAWGSHHFVVGGAVKGGQMVGTFPDITVGGADDVGNGQFIPTTSIDQLGASIAAWYGVSSTDQDTLFPLLGRFATRTLPLFV